MRLHLFMQITYDVETVKSKAVNEPPVASKGRGGNLTLTLMFVNVGMTNMNITYTDIMLRAEPTARAQLKREHDSTQIYKS